MDMFKRFTFVRFCFASASMLQEDLGLPTEKLICLYKECIEMAEHCNDICTMVFSCTKFVSHSNSIGRHADSLRCLKEILPSAVVIPILHMIVHELLSLTYKELKEFDNVVLHAKKWIEIARNVGDKENEIDGYREMAKAFASLDCYDDAIDCGKRCLEICQETESAECEVMACRAIMSMYQYMEKYEEAILYAHKLLDCAMKTNDQEAMMNAYKCIMDAYQYMQKHDDAIVYAHKLLDCAKKTNDQKAMLNAYLQLERAHHALNHYQDATDFGKKCIEVASEIEDRCGEVQAYLLMGQIYNALSDYDNVIIYYKKFIEIAINIGDRHAEAFAYSALGEVYYSLEKYDDAISNCNKCVHIDKENKTFDLIAYFTLGKVNHYSLEKYDEAIHNFKQCIDIVNRIGSEKEVAVRACLLLGEIYQTLKQYNDAVYHSEKCIDMAQETDEKTIEAQACLCLANIYQTLEQYDDVVYYGKKCIEMAQETGEKKLEMKGHICLVRAYECSKQLNDEFLSIDAGIAIATVLGDKDAEERLKINRAVLHGVVGLHEKRNSCDVPSVKELTEVTTCSEDDLLEDLAQAVKTGEEIKEIRALTRLCSFYGFKNDHEKTMPYLKQWWKQMNFMTRSVNLLSFIQIGKLYQLMGQNDMALRCLKEGLPTAESCSDNAQRSQFYYALGKLLFSLNRELNLVEGYLREAIRCFEAVFTTLGSLDEFKISIFDQYFHSYKFLALLLIGGEQIEEALLVLDRCRARALKDLMTSNFKMEQEESNDEHLEYSDVLSLVSRNDFSISYYSLCFDIFLKFFLGGEINLSFSFASLQIHVDTLFDEMGVCEVVNCEDRSLDKEQDIQKEQNRSEEDYEGLNKPTASLLNLDSKRGKSNENSAETKGSTLEVLFGILECDRILSSKQDEVVVIPEGPLYEVPFPALRDPRTGKYLSETKRIRLAPSLATLKHFEDFPTDRTSNAEPLIIGSPLVGKVMMDGEEQDIEPLFGALDEAIDIADILGVSPLVLADATKPRVLEKLQQGVSIVHIAAHGILSKATIVLAPSPEIKATKIPDEEDYMLTMAEVQQAQVRAQLVVLSCCHSGRGEIRAEGVVGMCRAFLASGARAVIASLWAIDDEATLEFMKKFYHSLKDGKSASAGLQQTMKEMRNTTSYSEPKYWAPFFLMGDDVTLDE